MEEKETKLILVRHGQSVGNAQQFMQGQMDTPLTDLGREQAKALAKRLKGYGISAIYTSDLSRAYETAQIVGEELGIEPVPDPRLREIDLGGWSGLTRAEVIARYPEEWKRWEEGKDIEHAGGESFSQFWERVREVLNEIIDRHRGETVLIVAHGGVTRIVASKVLGLGFREMFTDLPPMINTSLTEILIKDGEVELLSLADSAHLEEARIVGKTTSWWRGGK
jgi:broad specificity phosphatase PhoE